MHSSLKFRQRLAAAVVLALMPGIADAQTTKPHTTSTEQTEFSAEHAAVRLPVPLPPDVRTLLLRDTFVQQAMASEGIAANALPATWFSASAIHLGAAHRADLIVEAEGPLRGANVNTFWVFVATRDGYRLALTIPAHDLRVLRKKSRGYREIETYGMTCCTITTVRFRFNGSNYEHASEHTEDIR